MRSDDEFNIIVKDTKSFISKYDLDELVSPRVQSPPKRYSGTGDQYAASSAEEHYKATYLEIIDTATTQLREHFNRQSSGLQMYMKLESMFLLADVNTSISGLHPELCEPNLSMQLRMFRSQNSYVMCNFILKM